jgi:hypothetical protein
MEKPGSRLARLPLYSNAKTAIGRRNLKAGDPLAEERPAGLP